jgi:hypothetical protein|tara:strand:- start:194 stop:562 length:369 start_codon:yes stop_codon:yes gene_type:complete
MIPLFGQQTETDKEITKQEQREIRQNLAQEKMNKHSWGQKMWMGVQDAEWRKFEAAHKRAHMKALGHKGYKVKKPTKTHRVLSYVFVGGISFWIGHEYAKKSHHKSSYKKRPYGWETRGDKK